MDPTLLDLLQELRYNVGAPLVISSGFRCVRYNGSLPGAKKGSFHTQGLAADIYCPSMHWTKLIRFVKDLPFRGIGGYPDEHFVHVDVGHRPQVVTYWIKRRNLGYQYCTEFTEMRIAALAALEPAVREGNDASPPTA